MRLRKYYDSWRTNNAFRGASFGQKNRILSNVLKYFRSNKALVIRNKPVTAQIEPTSECNLDCEMCIRKEVGVPIGTMSLNDFKIVLDKLDGLYKIHLSGQGEPFLNKEIFDIIKYANKKGILVNLNTNGILMTKSVVKKILEVDVGEIAVSLESANSREYEKIRRGGKFEVLINNVKNLSGELKSRGKNTIVSFAVTIFKENIEEMKDFVKLASDIGVSKIIAQTIQEKEDYVSKYSSDADAQRVRGLKDKINHEVGRARELAKEKGISLIFDEEKSDGCLWPWRGIYVTWNGYVTPCCKILDYRAPCFGNLLQEDFWDIWNGALYQNYRRLLRVRKVPPKCRGCAVV